MKVKINYISGRVQEVPVYKKLERVIIKLN